MTLMQMRYFAAVCQDENVTKAAETLHVSQPSVSNAIRSLESELGVPLFHRIKRRLILTQEGEIFRREVLSLLQAADRLEQKMRELGENRKLVRIGVPPMVGTILFPPMLVSFRELYPDVRMEITEHGSMSCRDQVSEETLDLAIVITNGLDVGRLRCLPIMETQLVFCVSERHPLSGRASVTLEDCCTQPQILLPDGSYNRALMERLYKARGLQPNVLLYSSQLYTIESLIREGAAAAFLFRELAERMQGVVGIPLEPEIEPIHIGLIWKRNIPLFADVTHFIEFSRGYSEILHPDR